MGNNKVIQFEAVSMEEAKEKGYKTFNECIHYIADMSHLESGTDDWMNTVSIKLPNGRQATLCLMQCSPSMFNIDISIDKNESDEIKAIRFHDGTADLIKGDGTYAVIVEDKNTKEYINGK